MSFIPSIPSALELPRERLPAYVYVGTYIIIRGFTCYNVRYIMVFAGKVRGSRLTLYNNTRSGFAEEHNIKACIQGDSSQSRSPRKLGKMRAFKSCDV